MSALSKEYLTGKVALITGAAQGIGLAIAARFCAAGAQVILTDIQDDRGAAEAKRLGDSATYRHLDVRSEEDWSQTVAWVMQQFNKMDVLINNAGITGFAEGFGAQDPEKASLESWHAVHSINLDGVFLGCREAIKAMKEYGGVIVNVSSRSGIIGIPAAAAYASSKAAMRNHTKTVALYCAQNRYPIRCNSLHPAAVWTPMWEAMVVSGTSPEALKEIIAKDIPMGRMGTVEEVAEAALFLASEASSYMTGTELHLDDGLLAGSAASPAKR